jgi:hypothetical protein
MHSQKAEKNALLASLLAFRYLLPAQEGDKGMYVQG